MVRVIYHTEVFSALIRAIVKNCSIVDKNWLKYFEFLCNFERVKQASRLFLKDRSGTFSFTLVKLFFAEVKLN